MPCLLNLPVLVHFVILVLQLNFKQVSEERLLLLPVSILGSLECISPQFNDAFNRLNRNSHDGSSEVSAALSSILVFVVAETVISDLHPSRDEVLLDPRMEPEQLSAPLYLAFIQVQAELWCRIKHLA